MTGSKHPNYQTFGPDAFVLGQVMLTLFEISEFPAIEHFLTSRGLSKIEPEAWYPQQIWLDIFNDIVDALPDASITLLNIGIRLMDNVEAPPMFWEMPFLNVLQTFGDIYALVNNRGKDIGSIQVEILDVNHVVMHDATPYPDEFVIGAYFATARLFLSNYEHFSVYFDPLVKPRSEGGSETVVHIVWK